MKNPLWLLLTLGALVCLVVGGLAAHFYWPQQPFIINLPPGVKAKDFTGHISLEPANYSAIIGTIPAILSAITAIVAVSLTSRQLRFAHEERTAALRNKLSERRTELYSEFSALAVRIANTITIVAQERRRLLGSQTTRSGENEIDWKSSDVYQRYRETVLDFNDCHQKMLIVATVGVLKATEDLRLELDRFEDIVLGKWPDVSEYPQVGKRATEVLDVISQHIEAFTAEARSDLGTERISEQLSKVLSERVTSIRSF